MTLESSDDGAPDESPNSNVIASERELRRSVQNLIRNALLHGSPPVTVVVRDADSGVQILVTDHGPGFGSDDPVRLRRPFERGTSAIADQRPGSGLGLAVASDVVAGLGGSLHLADGPDGAVATITLPTR